MPVELLGTTLRKYQVTCDVCRETEVFKTRNKITLRDRLRDNDWSWRDLGFLGIVECTCPECMKEKQMSSKAQLLEMATVEKWISEANSNTLLSFQHMVNNIAIDKKTSIERAKVLAYRRMKKKGMIQG